MLVVIVVLGLMGSTATDSPTPTPAPEQTQAATFDIPSIVNKSTIEEVKAVLGQAAHDEEPTAEQLPGTKEWWITYEKDGQDLTVTYNPQTRKVIDFFISTDDPGGATNDTARLLSIGNLQGNSEDYAVEFIRALKGGGYTGVKVTPK